MAQEAPRASHPSPWQACPSTFTHGGKAPLALKAFPCLLDIGEALLLCGADVHSVEETLSRLGCAYGARKMNVFVITATIVATMTLPDGYEHTITRRVMGEASIDFNKLEQLSNLCATALETPLEPHELQGSLSRVHTGRPPLPILLAGGTVSAGAFALFFGGSLLDALVSAAFAVLICLAIRYVRPWMPNAIIFNFVSSFLCGLGVMATAKLFGDISPDMVMIGDIMLLIPGVAMTNATRDMLSGDTISGVMRFIESLLWAVALALGFMAAIWLAQMAW